VSFCTDTASLPAACKKVRGLILAIGSDHGDPQAESPRRQVLFAESGEEALALLAGRGDIDLVLMDVQMPGMDGFETAMQIKQMEGARDIPIIFVTAIYTEDPFIRRGYEVGGIDYFSKPFDPAILKMKVAVYSSFRLKAEFLRERERHIRESEELLRVDRKLSSVLDSLPVGVLIADPEGRQDAQGPRRTPCARAAQGRELAQRATPDPALQRVGEDDRGLCRAAPWDRRYQARVPRCGARGEPGGLIETRTTAWCRSAPGARQPGAG
jgi:CheY-like chemotaxis protein